MIHQRPLIRRDADGRILNINVKDLLRQPDGFSMLREALSEMHSGQKSPPSSFDLPPWAHCPNIPRGSIGWRMGYGEDLMHAFIAWYRALAPKDREAFVQCHPEPEEWDGFYAIIT